MLHTIISHQKKEIQTVDNTSNYLKQRTQILREESEMVLRAIE